MKELSESRGGCHDLRNKHSGKVVNGRALIDECASSSARRKLERWTPGLDRFVVVIRSRAQRDICVEQSVCLKFTALAKTAQIPDDGFDTCLIGIMRFMYAYVWKLKFTQGCESA